MWLKAVVVFLAAGLEWCDRKAPFALHHNHSQVAAQRKQVAPQHSTSIQEMEEIEGSPKELELIGEFKKLVQPHLETGTLRAVCVRFVESLWLHLFISSCMFACLAQRKHERFAMMVA